MLLKPQDIVVLLHLALRQGRWGYASVAQALGLATSAVHSAFQRALQCGLADGHKKRPRVEELLEFILHGLKYVLPVVRGGLTIGIPTAHAAPPLKDLVRVLPGEAPPVWPDPEGSVRGESWEPLHESAVFAARRDPKLYEVLSLVDAIRGGRARERKLAAEQLRNRLGAR